MTTRRAPSLLVLQLDSDKLRRDGLALAEFANAVRWLCLDARIEIVQATDLGDLHERLAFLASRRDTFDAVVAIGHSNERGIAIASDGFATWKAFGRYLKPFEVRRLVLVACSAGRWPAAQTLFQTLPKLRRIYASPVTVSGKLGTLMVALAPYILHVKAPRDGLVFKAQIALGIVAGGQVRQWMRTRDMHSPEGVILDLVATAADPLLRNFSQALSSMLMGRR